MLSTLMPSRLMPSRTVCNTKASFYESVDKQTPAVKSDR